MRKKTMIPAAVLWMAIVAIVGLGSAMVAFAWFTEKKTVVNTVEIADNTITLEENIEGLYKRPKVANTGGLPCYVRLRAVISDGEVADYIRLDYNTDRFTYRKEDGFYYYERILQPGEKTEPLFTKVEVSETMPQELKKRIFEIDVYAESVVPGESKDAVSAFALADAGKEGSF